MIYAMSQPLVFKLIDKAVHDYDMIEPGDKILVGASGGKDSSLLLEYFSKRVQRPDCGFEFKAVHVKTEITPPLTQEQKALFEGWGIDSEQIDSGVLSRIREGKKMNCWWCSTQRRKELLHYAITHGYNKIALGHHMDDLLETLLMNMLYKCEIASMPPKLKYAKYPVTIIRPLCIVTENSIIEHSKRAGYHNTTCTCMYQNNSGRKEARRYLEYITEGSVSKKEHLFTAMQHVVPEYLP